MMKKINIVLYLPVIFIGIVLAGCESPDVTEVTKTEKDSIAMKDEIAKRLNQLELSPDIEPGFHFRKEPSAKVAESWAKLKEQRKTEKVHQKSKGLPEEIVRAHEQLLEDLKAFYGVDELPETEIAPGVTVLAPRAYLKGEKYKKLNDFLSKRYQKLMELYEKYGLKGEVEGQRSKSVLDEIPSILQVLGYGGSFATAYRLDPSTAVGNYYSYTEAFSIVYYLDVVSDYYAAGIYLGEGVNRNYNSSFVDLSLGPVQAPGSFVCYDILSTHFLYDGVQYEQFPSSGFDCI